MSGYYNQPESEGEQPEENTGRGLRKQLEEVLAANKKMAERLERLERGTSPTDVLKGAGLDPALVAIIPPDADPKEWVEKYAHLLGAKEVESEQREEQPEEQPEVQSQAPEDEDPAVTLEREAVEAMQGARQDGSPSVITSDVIERMNKIDNEADLMRFINSNGAG